MSNFFQMMAMFVVYIVLFIAGIKFYLWSRKQQKKHEKRWRNRLGLLLFFAPILIFLVDAFSLPLQENVLKSLRAIVEAIDFTLAWFKTVLEPALGKFGYFLIRPLISSLVYAFFGYLLGSVLDFTTGKKENQEEKSE